MSEPITVISFDPGKNNFAYAIAEYRLTREETGLNYRIHETGLMQVPIQDLKAEDLTDQFSKFRIELESLLMLSSIRTGKNLGDVKLVTMERYMGRGVQVGTTIEVCGIMIGTTLSFMQQSQLDCRVNLITSAIWKNAFNRLVETEKKNGYLNETYNLCSAPNHELDAVLIGMYGAYRYFGFKGSDIFSGFEEEKRRDKLLDVIEKVSVSKLENRRAKRKYYPREV